MTYKETIEYLYTALPMFQAQGDKAYKPGLERTVKLLEIAGNPHREYMTIHVAGTNGKGTVSHALASVLHQAGYRTGLYTSPHMQDFRERVRLNGKIVDKGYVRRFVEKMRPHMDEIKPSFFEITAVLAFSYFKDAGAKIAVVETGMGGRLDATNVITPLLSIITNIGKDHMQFLGSTLPLIAKEKAGIIKKGVPVVIGETAIETKDVFIEASQALNAPVFFADLYYTVNQVSVKPGHQVVDIFKNGGPFIKKLKTDLTGAYQLKNIATSMMAIEVLKENGVTIKKKDVAKGLRKVKKTTGLRGRWDIIGKKPLTIVDSAHNAPGLQHLCDQADSIKHNKLYIVFGMVNDKDTGPIFEALPREAFYFFCRAPQERALDDKTLYDHAILKGFKGIACGTVKQALQLAKQMAGKKDLLLVTGSTFVAAEALKG